MKRVCYFIFVAMIACSLFGQDASSDELWQKAKARAQRSWNLVPGMETTVTQVINKKGEIEMTNEVQLAHTLRNDGTIRNTIKAIVINGEDETQKQKDKKQFRHLEEADATPENNSIFHGRDDAVVRRIGAEEMIDGVRCISYSCSYNKEFDGKKTRITNEVWLDEDGILRRSSQTLDPLPKMVKEMQTAISYTYDSQKDIFFPRQIEITMKVSVMLMKRTIKTVQTFSDYWPYSSR